MIGINLAGAEFGSAGGAYGTNYIYPNNAGIDYYASKGMDVIRLPFLWERVQKSQNGPLDSAELARIDAVVNYAATKGMKVILDVHNYGSGFGNVIGTSGTPNSSFADLWGKLASHFKSDGNVMFGLMNEPHKQSASQWLVSANAAIDAIRDAGATQEILVPGSYWDGAHSWVSSDNDTVMGNGVKDPLNNFMFEVHQYLDSDSSGTSPTAVSATIGVERLKSITEWAKATDSKLFLGEFGAANNATSLQALDGMLKYMDDNADVWEGATYWAGGPWWGNYMFSVEPTNGVDKPQMAILQKYDLESGGGTSPTPPAPAPAPAPSPAPAPAPTNPAPAPAPAPTAPSAATVSIDRTAGHSNVLKEGEAMALTIKLDKAVAGQKFDVWHSNTMSAADFVNSLAADIGKGLPAGLKFTATSATRGTITVEKAGDYAVNLVRQTKLDGVTETKDQASWAAGAQEQTDIFIANASSGLTIKNNVVSNWVTDVAGTAAPQPSTPTPSQPAPAPTTPTSPTKEFVGTSGADRLEGTSGADVLKGLGGNDTYVVNNVGDKVVELDGQGRDKILSSIDLTLPKAIEDILLTGAGNISATGNALNNTITGQSGNNVLRGGDGNDVIDGKGGQDKLYGDGGKDKFVFSSASDSKVSAPDMIMDFLKGSDVIDIRAIDANTLLAGDQKFVFIGDQEFAGSGQLRVEYDAQTNVTHVQGSVDYDAVADFQIDLAGKVALSASDFLL